MSPISPTLACVRVRVRVHEPLSVRWAHLLFGFALSVLFLR